MTSIVKITEKDKVKIKKLYEKDKLSPTEIAKKYKVHRASIAYHLKRMKVKNKPPVIKTIIEPYKRKLKVGKSYKDYVAEDKKRELKKKNN